MKKKANFDAEKIEAELESQNAPRPRLREDIRGTYSNEQTKKEMGVQKKEHDKKDDERMHC